MSPDSWARRTASLNIWIATSRASRSDIPSADSLPANAAHTDITTPGNMLTFDDLESN